MLKQALKLSVASAALVVASGVALAADVVVEEFIEPIPQERGWSGFYIGAHIGYGSGDGRAWNDNNNNDSNPIRSADSLFDEFGDPLPGYTLEEGGYVLTDCFDEGLSEYVDCPGAVGPWLDADGDIDGVLGGLQAGYDWQWNRFVFGVVGDASVSGISGYVSRPATEGDYVGFQGTDGFDYYYDTTPASNIKFDLDWLATLRLRAGWLITPDFLGYIHGGLAVGEISLTGIQEGPYQNLGGSDTAVGYVVGAGAEWRLDERYSIFGEYSYVDLGDVDVWQDGPRDVKAELDFHMFKAGFNIRFNGFGG